MNNTNNVSYRFEKPERQENHWDEKRLTPETAAVKIFQSMDRTVFATQRGSVTIHGSGAWIDP